ncbi:hypothetical protein [Candidatus Xianfuyuplasma coldseepsis]|uniref:Uncharacterized protein n=1 Tax=Candidatus Xianfuyuplasma coldseepsis TaxID=2782163 RepID=A0A7L7KRG2_9MOLU|nr:hypothetical protein [Xianfuyuplasma coldseepsis]QMS85175.1 hypothetical protein G4Z02_05245 [Xianfuyuplasma coldseepsis]
MDKTSKSTSCETDPFSEACLSSDLVGLESYNEFTRFGLTPEYVEQLKVPDSNDDIGDRNTIIYASNDELVYYNRDQIFYRVIGETVEEYTINYNNYTPGVMGYNPIDHIVYLTTPLPVLYGTEHFKNAIEYDFDDDSHPETGEYVIGQTVKVIANTNNGLVMEYQDDYYVYNGQFELSTTYSEGDAYFVGANHFYQRPGEGYFLFVEEGLTSCNLWLHDGDDVVTTIDLEHGCSYGQHITTNEYGVFFLVGEEYGDQFLYRFDGGSLSAEHLELYDANEPIEYLYSVGDYYGFYELRLRDHYITCFDDEFRIDHAVPDCGSENAMGDSFYATHTKGTSLDIVVYDLNNTEINRIENDNYLAIPFHDFLSVRKGYSGNLYNYDIYWKGTDLVLEDIPSFVALDSTRGLYMELNSDTDFNVVYKDFSTNESIILQSLTAGPNIYESIYCAAGRGNTFYIHDIATNMFHVYDIDGTSIESFTYLGTYRSEMLNASFILERDNGEVVQYRLN